MSISNIHVEYLLKRLKKCNSCDIVQSQDSLLKILVYYTMN
jgi:hypothetical protein